MMPAQIHVTRRGLLVKATSRDFPSLAALEVFLDMRPAERLQSIQTVGSAA